MDVRASDAQTRFVLAGELDIATADELGTQLEAAAIGADGHLVIDLTAVTFMDSTGLRKLITAHREAEEHGYAFTIVTGESPAKRVLELTRMDGVLNAVATLD